MKKTTITTAIAVAMIFTTQAQNFQWVKTIGGKYEEIASSIAVDGLGNVYSTGYFRDTVDFDPGSGFFNMISPAPGPSTYITKFDASGNFVWAKNMGTTVSWGGQSITIDATGNLYTFSDYTISKLDSSGNIIWSKQIGGVTGVIPGGGPSSGRTIAVDASGNVYTTGVYGGTSDFDPGPGVFNLTAASANSGDIFVCKLDASGNFVWAKSMGGTSDDGGFSIAVDHLGKVYTTGYFKSSADFDPGSGTFSLTAGGADIFVSKLNASGDFVWAKNIGGTSYDFGKSIAVDSANNVYTTGFFYNTADFDPSAGTYNLTAAGSDIFVSKLSGSGNFIWARQMGGTGYYGEQGNAIALDASGNVFITGDFSGTADFDPGVGTYNLVSQGYSDIFVSELNSSGDFVFAKSMGGSNGEGGLSITADASGNEYVSGAFLGTCDFDPGNVVFNRTAVGASDIFIEKLGQECILPTAGDAEISANGNATFCHGDSVVFTVASAGFLYQWKKGNNILSGATQQSFTAIHSGNYKCDVSNNCGSITSNTISVTVNAKPTVSISQAPCANSAVLLTCTSNPSTGVTFKWRRNSAPIAGATNSTYSATQSGTYKCIVTITSTGCTKSTVGISVTVNCKSGEVIDNSYALVYPNPSSNYFNINTDQLDRQSEIYIYDLTGRLVESSKLNCEEIKVGASLSNGMYFLKIVMNGEVQQVIKLIKNF